MQASSISTVRGRIIPIVAVSLVIGLLVLLGWTLLGPKSADTQQNGRINAPGVFIPFQNRDAPNFSVTDFNTGKKISLADLKGKTVVLNFWASWCPPCQTEAPLINAYVKNNPSNDVVFVGVAIWDVKSDSENFVQQYGIQYMNGADTSGTTAIDYGVAGVPETFIISPDGKLTGKFPGPITNADQLTNALKESTGG